MWVVRSVLFYAVLCYVVLYCTALRCTILKYTILFYTILCHTILLYRINTKLPTHTYTNSHSSIPFVPFKPSPVQSNHPYVYLFFLVQSIRSHSFIHLINLVNLYYSFGLIPYPAFRTPHSSPYHIVRSA